MLLYPSPQGKGEKVEEMEKLFFIGNGSQSEIDRLNNNGINCKAGEKAYYIDGKEIPEKYGIKSIYCKSEEDYKKYNILMQTELEKIRRS